MSARFEPKFDDNQRHRRAHGRRERQLDEALTIVDRPAARADAPVVVQDHGGPGDLTRFADRRDGTLALVRVSLSDAVCSLGLRRFAGVCGASPRFAAVHAGSRVLADAT